MAVDRWLEEKREEILKIAASDGASNVRGFGSRARGEGGPESDFDILVGVDVFMSTPHWRDAVARQLEIIGEATKGLSPARRSKPTRARGCYTSKHGEGTQEAEQSRIYGGHRTGR